MPTGNQELDEKIEEFLHYAQDLPVAEDVKKLLADQNHEELRRIMLNRLSFGTAGLRGRMGPGYSAMNDLVIIQTSQGVASYLEKISSESEKRKGVVIGFDNRHNSQRFSNLVALSFLLKGFRVFLFSNIVPTPFVPFAVKRLKTLAGIMVTASHNPKYDNGYKVYWSNGSQILSPHDKNIQESILGNLKPWPGSMDTSLVWSSPLVSDPLSEVKQMYYAALKSSAHDAELLQSCSLRITFTAMHGVSHSYMKEAFQRFGYEKFVAVPEQMMPDPDFPTVHFPNPEEQSSLLLSIACADKDGSTLILANDPDADRLAVAEKVNPETSHWPTLSTSDGGWHLFTGNEVGALLGVWLWKTTADERKSIPSNCCMISSTVSSKILRSIAAKEGFVHYETLTGFKWMANKAHECMANGMKFVFAFEEAIGYMCGEEVLDKDGIQAAMQLAQMAAHAEKENKQLVDLLHDIYTKYGLHLTYNTYFICENPEAIAKMFYNLRNHSGSESKYPWVLQNGNHSFPVKRIRDLTLGYDSGEPDQKAALPASSSTQMITFFFDNGCEATLRTSGTEPKIKLYTEIISEVPEPEWNCIQETLHNVIDVIIDVWIEPTKYGFRFRS